MCSNMHSTAGDYSVESVACEKIVSRTRIQIIIQSKHPMTIMQYN